MSGCLSPWGSTIRWGYGIASPTSDRRDGCVYVSTDSDCSSGDVSDWLEASAAFEARVEKLDFPGGVSHNKTFQFGKKE